MSTFGSYFKVTTYGESHCKSVGCIVDGCPPNIKLDLDYIQKQLTRRRPGQSDLTTPRNEYDQVEVHSGTENNVTLGTPLLFLVRNKDQRPNDYTETDLYPRPSHADYTYLLKYNVKAKSGGGRSSARETIGRVCAGTLAEFILKKTYNTQIVAFVSSVGKVKMDFLNQFDNSNNNELFNTKLEDLIKTLNRETVDKDITRCPEPETAESMKKEILDAKQDNDSIGGTVMCFIKNCPMGIGEPCFDKLEAKLAHAMLSIPATKGFEIGSGFKGTELRGSKHNDMWVMKKQHEREDNINSEGVTLTPDVIQDQKQKVGTELYHRYLDTKTNNSGGVQGGISNGNTVIFKVAFKPPATISREQQTASYIGEHGVLTTRGRHDPCVVPRAVPIVEAMTALVIMDLLMAQLARKSSTLNYLLMSDQNQDFD